MENKSNYQKYKKYYDDRQKQIAKGTWKRKTRDYASLNLSEEELKKIKYEDRHKAKKQYVAEIDVDIARIFEERVKQYGDKKAEILRQAINDYIASHPDKS